MEKTYDPKDIEQRIYQRWEANGWFAPSGDGKPYSHRHPAAERHRHAAHGPRVPAHADGRADPLSPHGGRQHAVAAGHRPRRHRDADGRRAPAQRRRHAPPRPRPRGFVERVWEWKAQSGDTISRQVRRLGNSVDWSRERFTMDEGLSRAVTEVFVRLHEEGLIYRGKRLVNWDPVLHTALSDLEVLSRARTRTRSGTSAIRSRTARGHLVVATTRPETMLGDTAVAVHPEDERYRHLIGKQVRLPLTDRAIPIIADDYVDPRVRLRLRQDHARARLQRLRARQAPRAAADQHLRRRTRRSTTTVPAAVPRPRSLRRAQARRRRSRSARPGREDRAAHAAGAARRPQRRGARALAHRSVVRAHRAARRARDRGRRRRPHPLRARELGEDLLPVDAQHPGLVHQPPAVVGPPDPRVVRRRRATSTSRARKRKRSAQARAKLGRDVAADARRGRARHLVLLGAVAVLDARLAGADAGAARRSIRPACWSPASTSSSSGSRA